MCAKLRPHLAAALMSLPDATVPCVPSPTALSVSHPAADMPLALLPQTATSGADIAGAALLW